MLRKLQLVLLFIATVALAQAQHQRSMSTVKNNILSKGKSNISVKSNNLSNKILMSPPFFSENFGGGIPASWTVTDNLGGGGVIWEYTTTGASYPYPFGYQLNPVNTTASNGYVKVDSDSAIGEQVNTSLTTPAINCSGKPVVHLSFAEYFVQYDVSTATVEVSNDGTNWTAVHHADAGIAPDSTTANPNLVDIDISSVAANQATVYIRFTYVADYEYWWFVDDVALYEPSSIDLASMGADNLAGSYTSVPLSQCLPQTMKGKVKNTGTNTVSNATALFEVVNVATSGVVHNEIVNIPAIAPGTSQNITSTTTFAPIATGQYKLRMTVNAAGDGNSLNDVSESVTMTCSDSVYARDNGLWTDFIGVGAGAGENGMAGNKFRVNTNDVITSVSMYLSDTNGISPSGLPVYLTIHSQVNDTVHPDNNILATTDTITLMPGMIAPGGQWFNFKISGSSLSVSPGLYFVAFHEDADMLAVGYSNNIYSSNACWVYFNSNTMPLSVDGWSKFEDLGYPISLMIRANFGSTVGIANHDNNYFEVYPNPSSGQYTIRLAGNESKNIEIFDLQGQLVKQFKVEGQFTRVNLSDVADGLYQMVVYTQNGNQRKILVKNSR
ncbi:MAG: T9SS type A sorting domain-containing protein [Bacteroidetes bacterium]|jgi:hypothetical protein|nr:T9SS type A sorting domain-containing protein [Bacteroidota bacterium]